ncbi:MAG TPA: type III-A CRISPR-associated protein Csm2 [Thermoflexus sp.]|nr:type III-A CRISPR-associated protein Csm2 [Thermoflexus sp.]
MQDLRDIITDPNGVQKLVERAREIGHALAPKSKDDKEALSTSQIRALFGEVRQIQAEWSIDRQRAFRRLVLLRPKMAYRARKERGKAVEELVGILDPALEYVIKAPPKEQSSGKGDNQDDNFQRFVEFFEAILAYHKAYGGQ